MGRDSLTEHLEWDSDFFGVRIARVTAPRLTGETMTAVMDTCRAERVDCLYFLCSPENDATVRLAEECGFHLVDIRVTLDRQVVPASGEWRSESPGVRLAKEDDIPALRLIAAGNHRDSRFYHDGNFSFERCDELYATWIEKSCRGYAHAVLVAECGTGAAGYLSCHLRENQVGQIGLVGVSSTCRGKGLGRQLLHEAVRWFSAAGVTRIEVVTQGRNLGAQRLYQKGGFMTASLQLWYHRWFTPAP